MHLLMFEINKKGPSITKRTERAVVPPLLTIHEKIDSPLNCCNASHALVPTKSSVLEARKPIHIISCTSFHPPLAL